MNVRQLWEQLSGKRGAAAKLDSEVVIVLPSGGKYKLDKVRTHDGVLHLEAKKQ